MCVRSGGGVEEEGEGWAALARLPLVDGDGCGAKEKCEIAMLKDLLVRRWLLP